MFGNRELANLIEMAKVYRLRNGWQLVIRAEWTDVTPQRPHGLSYAFILQDVAGERLLGFDNSHKYDGAGPEEPFDHEHVAGRVGERVRYTFSTASALVQDGFARCESYCAAQEITFEFEDDQ